jgi:predicted nucleic acid-binding protein
MNEQIIDTSVLIDFLRGHDGAVRFLDLARNASRLQIAATAMRLGRTIATQNVKHFAAFSGLEVVKAY